jgi:hypothetical protein
MLKTIGWVVKGSAFALIILVVANYFHVGDKTISDQVKTQLSHAERAEVVGHVKDWAHEISADQRDGIVKKVNSGVGKIAPFVKREEKKIIKTADEEIPSSERQKLKALMRELNSSHD